MAQCRLRTEGEETILSLTELEERLRAGDIPPGAWVDVPGMTVGFRRLRDTPLARLDPGRRHRFRLHFALDRVPGLVLLVAAACVALHVWMERASPGPVSMGWLVHLGARARTAIRVDGEVWRLWSGALLHRDLWHLAFNTAVFVAVGGALESVYSRAGLVAVLLGGALGSALLGLWLGPPVTVGLSGVVFATLGAAIGFGARFRDVLRRPYQQWFGAVALAYALFALWTGARSPDVDHAGHLGGLLSGLVLGLMLPPRKWDVERRWWGPDVWVLLGVGVVSGAAAGGLWWDARQPRPPREHRAAQAGVTLHVPWGFGAHRDPFGLSAFDNGLDAQVALGCARSDAAWPHWSGYAPTARTIAMEWAHQADAREVLDFRVEPAPDTTVGGEGRGRPWRADQVAVSYRVDGEEVQARVLGFERGLTRCVLVLAHTPQAPPAREGQLDVVRRTLELGPTDDVARAQRAVQADPEGALAALERGLAALQVGDLSAARVHLGNAHARAGNDVWMAARAQLGLSHAALMELDGRTALGHALAARRVAPDEVDVAVALYGSYRMSGQRDDPMARALAQVLKQVRPGLVRP